MCKKKDTDEQIVIITIAIIIICAIALVTSGLQYKRMILTIIGLIELIASFVLILKNKNFWS